MEPIKIVLLGTLYPSKIKHVRDFDDSVWNLPCELCTESNPHHDPITKEFRPCIHRKNACYKEGACKHFKPAGKNWVEAREWRKLEAWR